MTELTGLNYLAIDPGTTASGYCCAVMTPRVFSIQRAGKLDNEQLRILLKSHPWGAWDWVIFEKFQYFQGRPAGDEVFNSVLWTGRFIEALGAGQSWATQRRQVMSSHICGVGNAKDAQVRGAMVERLGPYGLKKDPGPMYGIRPGDAVLALAHLVAYVERSNPQVIIDQENLEIQGLRP